MKLIYKDAFTKDELVEFINYLLKYGKFTISTQPFNYIFNKIDEMLYAMELEMHDTEKKSLKEKRLLWEKHKRIYKKIEKMREAVSHSYNG